MITKLYSQAFCIKELKILNLIFLGGGHLVLVKYAFDDLILSIFLVILVVRNT